MIRADLDAERVLFEKWVKPNFPVFKYFNEANKYAPPELQEWWVVWQAAIAAQANVSTMADCSKCKAIGAAYKIGKDSTKSPEVQQEPPTNDDTALIYDQIAIAITEAEAKWNASADHYNQWEALGLDEKFKQIYAAIDVARKDNP